jgi:hypothetical protein
VTPETYCDVFERLERERVRYVVIGGVAVALRGHVRPVADLDFAVERTPDAMSRALGALNAVGFVPSILLPLSALTMLRLFDHSQREVNLFVRPHVPFAELWADAERVGVGRGVARVASLEHLLRAKRIDGRPRDLLDISGLLAVKATSRAHRGDATAAAGGRDESEDELSKREDLSKREELSKRAAGPTPR